MAVSIETPSQISITKIKYDFVKIYHIEKREILMLKKDIKWIIILFVLAVLTIGCFSSGYSDSLVYRERLKHSATVTATVEESHLHFREDVEWYMGAGDDVEKIVKKVPYYTYSTSYIFEEKEYTYEFGDYGCRNEIPKGTQIELVIDSLCPSIVITEKESGKSVFASAWVYFLFFIAILFIWIRKKLKSHK